MLDYGARGFARSDGLRIIVILVVELAERLTRGLHDWSRACMDIIIWSCAGFVR